MEPVEKLLSQKPCSFFPVIRRLTSLSFTTGTCQHRASKLMARKLMTGWHSHATVAVSHTFRHLLQGFRLCNKTCTMDTHQTVIMQTWVYSGTFLITSSKVCQLDNIFVKQLKQFIILKMNTTIFLKYLFPLMQILLVMKRSQTVKKQISVTGWMWHE